MVSDCAVSNGESDPAAINNAAADAPSHWRTIILTCTSGRAPRPRTLPRRSRRCDSDNDYPMNDAGEIRKQAEGGLVGGADSLTQSLFLRFADRAGGRFAAASKSGATAALPVRVRLEHENQPRRKPGQMACSAFRSLTPSGTPQPVTASNPGPAL